MSTEKIIKGRCLCGNVSYQVQGKPKIVAHCFCVDCQRLSGAGHSTGAMFNTEQFSIQGKIGEYKLQSDNGTEVTRVFCPSCGSPILGKNAGMPGFVTITLGTLDDSSEFSPEVAVFDRNRQHWDQIDESVKAFETQPAWNPEDAET